MEVVGIVASLVQLTDAALRIAKTSKKLYKTYRGATNALKDADYQASSIQEVIDEFHLLRPKLDQSQPELISMHTRMLLGGAMEGIEEALEQLKKPIHSSKDRQTTAADKLRWTFLDKSNAEAAQKKLEAAKSTLMLALQLLDIRLFTIQHSSIERVLEGQSILKQQMGQDLEVVTLRSRSIESRTNPRVREVDSDDSDKDELPRKVASSRTATLDRPGPWRSDILDLNKASDSAYQCNVRRISRPNWSIHGTASTRWNDNRAVYSLSMKARLPWWLGQRALILEFKIQQYSLARSSLSFLPGHIGLSNYLPRESEIYDAVTSGDLSTVRSLLTDRKAGPNDRFPEANDLWRLHGHEHVCEEMTVLAAAVMSGNVSLVQYLINVGANVNLTFGRAHTSPLQLAIRFGYIDCVRLLLSRGASIDHLDIWGRTVAYYLYTPEMSLSDIREIVPTLIQVLVNASFTNFDQSESGFDSAKEIVMIYLWCPVETAEMLIRHGALNGRHGRRLRSEALSETVVFGSIDVFRVLLRDKHDVDLFPALSRILQWDRADLLEIMIEQGVDINRLHDKDQSTPLHRAVMVGPYEGQCLKFLLKNGVDPNARNDSGDTPMHNAAKQDWILCTQLLLKYGADPNARNDDGDTPMHIAAKEGSILCMQLLLDHGADLEARNKRGETPILISAGLIFWPHRWEALSWLVKNGANLLARDHEGRAPLHMLNARISEYGRYIYDHSIFRHCLELFLDHGADPVVRDHQGRTPLHVFINRNPGCPSDFRQCLEVLLSHGADPLARDHLGRTALHEFMVTVYLENWEPYLHPFFRQCLGVLVKYGADPRQPFPSIRRPLPTDIIDDDDEDDGEDDDDDDEDDDDEDDDDEDDEDDDDEDDEDEDDEDDDDDERRAIWEMCSTLRNEDIWSTDREVLQIYLTCLETYFPGSFVISDDEIYWDADEEPTNLKPRNFDKVDGLLDFWMLCRI